jgi:hypothetical protein
MVAPDTPKRYADVEGDLMDASFVGLDTASYERTTLCESNEGQKDGWKLESRIWWDYKIVGIWKEHLARKAQSARWPLSSDCPPQCTPHLHSVVRVESGGKMPQYNTTRHLLNAQ